MSVATLDSQPELQALSPESAFLFQPHPGVVHIEEPQPHAGGQLHIAHYKSDLSTHTSGIYEPEGFTAGITPVIAMHGALLTGVRGHNQKVAEEMMQDGALVIMMGQPRRRYPTASSLSLVQDSNEMMGFLGKLEEDGRFGPLDKLWLYGESQGAMKALVHLALANSYGRQIVDGMVAAPRFLKPINPFDVARNTKDAVNMAISGLNYLRQASAKELWEQRRTLQFKDMHAHLAVLPQLIKGEPGLALKFADPSQRLDVDLYGHDGTPEAYSTAKRLKRDFGSMSVEILRQYGHIDGIMSPETKQRRREMVARAIASPILAA